MNNVSINNGVTSAVVNMQTFKVPYINEETGEEVVSTADFTFKIELVRNSNKPLGFNNEIKLYLPSDLVTEFFASGVTVEYTEEIYCVTIAETGGGPI